MGRKGRFRGQIERKKKNLPLRRARKEERGQERAYHISFYYGLERGLRGGEKGEKFLL